MTLLERLSQASREETLSQTDLVWVAFGAACYFFAAFALGYAVDTETQEVMDKKTGKVCKHPRKKIMTWAVSTANSFVVSVLGVVYMFLHFSDERVAGWPTFPPAGTDAAFDKLLGRDDFGTIACVIFGMANVCDLFLGLVFYPENLSFLTTYFHHTVFTWLMVCAVTTHGGFVTTPSPFVPSFVMALPEEVPTFLLALGSVSKKLRTDLGFGITFFLLRIVYHLFLLYYVIASGCHYVTIGMYVLSTTLHVLWFKSWIMGTGFKYVRAIAGLLGIHAGGGNHVDEKND